MANDPKLIGYFYIDCPTWIHTPAPSAWKGPLFDPERLKSEAGRAELFELATRYYHTTHAAIRRYDPNHLILGDRYEAGRPIAEEVVRAATPYVDALSFQHFASADKVCANLAEWHRRSGKPVKHLKERPRDKLFFFWYAVLDAHRDWDGDQEWNESNLGPKHDFRRVRVPPFLVDDEAILSAKPSYYMPVNIGKTKVSALVLVCEREMIDTELV